MESIKIEIKTTNSAFEDFAEMEVVRILKKLISDIEQAKEVDVLRDINGNNVGSVSIF